VTSFIIANSNEELISGHANGQIKIWNLESLECRAIQQGCDNKAVYSLAVVGNKLLCGSTGGWLTILDLHTCNIIVTLQCFENSGVCSLINIDNRRFFAGAYENKEIKIWDLESSPPRCLAVLEEANVVGGHSLVFNKDKGQLFCESATGRVIKLDFSADHRLVLDEIADLLESHYSIMAENARERFLRMKTFTKYHQLDAIHKTCSSPLELAQGIRNYLAVAKI